MVAVVLDKMRVFRIRCGCSGVGAGVLDKVQVFWRVCGYAG